MTTPPPPGNPPAHTRVTWSGTLGPSGAGVEIWQFGLNLEPILSSDPALFAALALGLRNAWSSQLGSTMTPNVGLTRVRVAKIGPDGLVNTNTDGSYVQFDNTTAATGSGTGALYPLQTSWCVSLQTARPGATGKGRFFLPCPAVTLASDFKVPLAATNTALTACKNFLDAVNDATTAAGFTGEGDVRAVVASSKGYLSEVTSVRLGRVLDTQRSRRGDLIEDYQAAALAPEA